MDAYSNRIRTKRWFIYFLINILIINFFLILNFDLCIKNNYFIISFKIYLGFYLYIKIFFNA